MMCTKAMMMTVVVAAAMVVSVAVGQTPVLLKDVQTLTFNLGELSTGRRVPPQPKLTCEYSPNPGLNPTSFQCYNRGINDMGDVQWECKPNNLDPTLRVYKTNVNCEGFNYPNDPYIPAGSCILTYSLALSQPQQQQKQQTTNNYYQQQGNNMNQQGAYYPKEQQKYYRDEVPDTKNYYKSYHPTKSHPAMSHFLKTVIFCCFAGFVFLFVTKFISSRRRRNGNNRRRNNGDDNHRPNNNNNNNNNGGGGGGYNNDNDDHFGHGGGNGGNGGCNGCGGYQQRGFGNSFGPSVGQMGLAAAAVGLHVLDRRQEEQNRRRYEHQQQHQQQYYPPPPPSQQQQQPSYQSYGQQVPPRDEQRSFADTSRR